MKTIKVKLHAGLQSDCKTCSEPRPKKRKKFERVTKREAAAPTAEVAARRAVAADLGEDEPDKEEKFQLLQKYGIAAPRIDRNITKPSWQSEATWKTKLAQWFQATKGLVQRQQEKTYGSKTGRFSQHPILRNVPKRVYPIRTPRPSTPSQA